MADLNLYRLIYISITTEYYTTIGPTVTFLTHNLSGLVLPETRSFQ